MPSPASLAGLGREGPTNDAAQEAHRGRPAARRDQQGLGTREVDPARHPSTLHLGWTRRPLAGEGLALWAEIQDGSRRILRSDPRAIDASETQERNPGVNGQRLAREEPIRCGPWALAADLPSGKGNRHLSLPGGPRLGILSLTR